MMISTRGRYSLRMLIDLAEHPGYVPLKDVAARQDISMCYLEKILPVLVKNRIIMEAQGKGGAYRLCRPPEEITLGQVLRLTEGTLAPVACLECGIPDCQRAKDCPMLPVWAELNRRITGYLDSVQLSQLAKPPQL